VKALALVCWLGLEGAPDPPAEASPEQLAAAAAAASQGDAALAQLARLERQAPAFYAERGYDYLAASLWRDGGRPEVAVAGFAEVVARRGPLADHAALALARLLEREHPRRALALVLGFAARYRGSALGREAALLEVTLRAGTGDRLGAERARARLPRRDRRERSYRLFQLALGRGWKGEARSRARALLRERTTDRAAVAAGRWLAEQGAGGLGAEEMLELGRVLFTVREFGQAIRVLGGLTGAAAPARVKGEAWYLRGRAAMKAGDDDTATSSFLVLIADASWRQRALYQLGRLAWQCGEVEEAEHRFRLLAEDNSGPLAAQAWLKVVRIRTARGDVAGAREGLLELVRRHGPRARTVQEAAVELAGAELGQGRARAALADLARATPLDGAGRRELAYWRGVAFAELGEAPSARAEWELAVDGFDLLSALARQRLGELSGGGDAAAAAIERARRALAAGDLLAVERQARAALDAGARGEAEREALRLLGTAYVGLPAYRRVYELEGQPLLPETVPSRSGPGVRAALLHGIGLDAEAAIELKTAGGSDLGELYRIAELARRGGDTRTALLYAELLLKRLPQGMHPSCLPPAILRLLYPDAYGLLVDRLAAARAVDPDLVRAVMREESRFDPKALSPAGARGLMQFIPETARRIGPSIGRPRLEPEDVHEPEVAIPLGVSYLADLLRLFAGNEAAAVAAYNAGEEAAYEWLSRTRAQTVDELLREIEFPETRTYVDRVLTTLSRYRVRRQREQDLAESR